MVKNYFFHFCCIVLLSLNGYAQNLVPNPSFEQYHDCPWGIMWYQRDFDTTVIGWSNAGGTADYFNTCVPFYNDVAIPNNFAGSRNAHSGNAYVGFLGFDRYTVGGVENREAVSCRFAQPLQAGHQYSVTFYMALAQYHKVSLVATDRIGVNFSVNGGNPMGQPYHVQMTGTFLTDTSDWTRFHGVYTATGGENYMTIGNFNNGTYPNAAIYKILRPALLTGPMYPARQSAYIYIDDVCLFDISDSANITTGTRKDTSMCANETLVLNARSDRYDYKWNTGDTASKINITRSGTYWVRSFGNCEFTVDTFHVTVIEPKKLNIGKDKTYCYGASAKLESNSVYDHYLWNTSDTTTSITVTQTGQYVLTVTNVCGTQRDTVNITVLPEVPKPSVVDTMVCQYTASPVLSASGASLRWYTGTDGNYTFTQPVVPTDKPGEYTYYVTQTQGVCESFRQPVHVLVKVVPVVALGNDTTICLEKTLALQLPDGDWKYAWNTGAEGCCIEITKPGTYGVHATNICGDVADSMAVAFELCTKCTECEKCIFIPSAFTPNGDGRNDVFRPLPICSVATYHMIIINRWGAVLFETDDIKQVWDGTYNGQPVELGTYVYYVESMLGKPHNQQITLKGDVTVIR